jgi:hypothetical protein
MRQIQVAQGFIGGPCWWWWCCGSVRNAALIYSVTRELVTCLRQPLGDSQRYWWEGIDQKMLVMYGTQKNAPQFTFCFQRFRCHSVIMKTTGFSDIAPCSLIEADRRFRGAYFLHYQDDYTALYLRSLSSTYSPPWEPEISHRMLQGLQLSPLCTKLFPPWTVLVYSLSRFESKRFSELCK